MTLHSSLLAALPNHTNGSNNKGIDTDFGIETAIALDTYKYIRFNTKKFVSLLVLDIDNVYGDEIQWHNRIKSFIGITPFYTLKTDHGIQFAIKLDRLYWTKNKDGNSNRDEARLKAVKKAISSLMDGAIDEAGSNRLLGIWRNPMQHPTVTTDKKYTLDELLWEFEIRSEIAPMMQRQVKPQPIAQKPLRMAATAHKMKLSDGTVIQNGIDQGFHIGNRNNYLFNIGFKKVFENRDTQDQLLSDMKVINNSFNIEGLTENEVTAIHSSVEKLIPTMYQKQSPIKKPTAKYRQFMWDNSIHGKHNRQSLAAYKTAETKRQITAKSILSQMVTLFESGITSPSNTQIVEGLKIKLRQYQNVKQKFNPVIIFREWVTGLLKNNTNIGIKANCIGAAVKAFKGINKRVEKHFSDNGIAYFIIRDRDNWQEEIKTAYPPLREAAV